jgi:hypothetical protein
MISKNKKKITNNINNCNTSGNHNLKLKHFQVGEIIKDTKHLNFSEIQERYERRHNEKLVNGTLHRILSKLKNMNIIKIRRPHNDLSRPRYELVHEEFADAIEKQQKSLYKEQLYLKSLSINNEVAPATSFISEVLKQIINFFNIGQYSPLAHIKC